MGSKQEKRQRCAWAAIALVLVTTYCEASNALGFTHTVYSASILLAENSRSDTPPPERAECAARIRKFVTGLDALLSTNPNSVTPVRALLTRTFPMRKCDVEDVIAISRQSRFLGSVQLQPEAHVFTFSTARVFPSSRISVGFGIEKATGDSLLPFAQVNK
jgi:hypothetical protein